MNDLAVIGLGSPHGDDQFGWTVVDELGDLISKLTRERDKNDIDKLIADRRVDSTTTRRVMFFTQSASRDASGYGESTSRTSGPLQNLCVDLQLDKIHHPVDLLPTLDNSRRVILVDAAIGLSDAIPLRRLRFVDATDRATIEEIPHHGTHDVGLYQVLRMAGLLGKRTDHVEIWIGNARKFERLASMSPELSVAAMECAAQVAKEVWDARTVAG